MKKGCLESLGEAQSWKWKERGDWTESEFCILGNKIKQSKTKHYFSEPNQAGVLVRSGTRGPFFLLYIININKNTIISTNVATQNELLNCFYVRQVLEETFAPSGQNHEQLIFGKKHKRNQTVRLVKGLILWIGLWYKQK